MRRPNKRKVRKGQPADKPPDMCTSCEVAAAVVVCEGCLARICEGCQAASEVRVVCEGCWEPDIDCTGLDDFD